MVEEIRIEKIKNSAKYLESIIDKKLQEVLEKDGKKKDYVLKVEKMLSESRLAHIGLTNVYIFLIISIILGAIVGVQAYRYLNNFLAGCMIGFIAFYIPIEALKIEVSLQRRAVRKHLPHFFLTILQLFEATEDIIQVIEIAVKSIKNPLKQIFKEFLLNYNSGKEIDECILILKRRLDNPLMQKFADDIESNVKNNTRLKGIIEEYIIKAYNNQINYSERITENSGNISGLVILAGFMGYMVFTISRMKPELLDILTTRTVGKITVDVLIILIVITTKVMMYSISYEDSK